MAKGHKQTTTHAADAATTGMQNATYDASKRAASGYTTAGPDQNSLAAMGLFGNYANAGQQGMNALGGDQNAINGLMNPYMNDVIGGVNAQYGQDQQLLRKNTNDAATQAGAFGGDRAALEQGAQQGALSLGHQQQVGDLLHGGYNDALQRAAGLAQMGMGAAGAQFQGGDYLRNIQQQQNNPDIMRQQILAQGMQGGNAGNYTNSQYTKTGAMQNILGGAATLGGIFGGIPGLGGMMGGMFGGGQGGAGGYDVNDPSQNMFAGSNAMPFGANSYRGGLFGPRQ
jgi:hypothetical protein